MALDPNILILAAANIGAVGIIGKYLLRSVEKSNESLPVVLETLKTHSKAIEELFNSRNDHETQIAEVKTTHKLKGCDQPGKK